MGATKRIVHSTDFSPASEPAFTKALELARRDGAKLILVHAREPMLAFTDEGVPHRAGEVNAESAGRRGLKTMLPTGRKPGTLKEFHARLRRARTRLLRTVATTDEELASLDIASVRDEAESAALEVTAAMMSRLEDQERRELAEIEAAEARLEGGGFGVCEECGEAISRTRLRALPAARLCLRCQVREEAS